MIIAVDGPAAAGKGTLARRLAQHFGLVHLDTGGLYRSVALSVLRQGGDPASEQDAITGARLINDIDPNDPELRDEATGAAASLVARHQAVRDLLVRHQREIAEQGAVLDGRDIGTVICPHADHKLFITAS